MKKILYAVFLGSLCCSLLSFADADSIRDFSGSYHCTGYDPFSKTNYGGNTTVQKTGDTYQFTWDYGVNAKGESRVYHGTGIYDKKSKMMGVIFSDPDHSSKGVQLYRVDKNGSLNGKWTLLGKTETSDETCEKLIILSPKQKH